jgi:hypothetical protein
MGIHEALDARPFIDDIKLVQLAAPADQIAAVEPIVRAAGFEVVARGEVVQAHDTNTTIELLPATASPGLRRIEFTLAVAVPGEHVETIGRTRISVGPGPRAVWDFSNSASGP